jgi:hypothetical protein
MDSVVRMDHREGKRNAILRTYVASTRWDNVTFSLQQSNCGIGIVFELFNAVKVSP